MTNFSKENCAPNIHQTHQTTGDLLREKEQKINHNQSEVMIFQAVYNEMAKDHLGLGPDPFRRFNQVSNDSYEPESNQTYYQSQFHSFQEEPLNWELDNSVPYRKEIVFKLGGGKYCPEYKSDTKGKPQQPYYLALRRITFTKDDFKKINEDKSRKTENNFRRLTIHDLEKPKDLRQDPKTCCKQLHINHSFSFSDKESDVNVHLYTSVKKKDRLQCDNLLIQQTEAKPQRRSKEFSFNSPSPQLSLTICCSFHRRSQISSQLVKEDGSIQVSIDRESTISDLINLIISNLNPFFTGFDADFCIIQKDSRILANSSKLKENSIRNADTLNFNLFNEDQIFKLEPEIDQIEECDDREQMQIYGSSETDFTRKNSDNSLAFGQKCRENQRNIVMSNNRYPTEYKNSRRLKSKSE